jgi:hypothetical protein
MMLRRRVPAQEESGRFFVMVGGSLVGLSVCEKYLPLSRKKYANCLANPSEICYHFYEFFAISFSLVKRRSVMRPVEKITVINKGGYVFNFSIQWLSQDDGQWHTTDWNSGNYIVTQQRTTPPLNEIGVPDNALAVTPYGHAVTGTSGQGQPFVAFAPNSQIATYEAVGTPLIRFAINLIS